MSGKGKFEEGGIEHRANTIPQVDEIKFRSIEAHLVLAAADLARSSTVIKNGLGEAFSLRAKDLIALKTSEKSVPDPRLMRKELRDAAVDAFKEALPKNATASDIVDTFSSQLDAILGIGDRGWPSNIPG